MGARVGADEVVAAARAALAAVAPVPPAVSGPRGSRAGWAAALGELQRVADVVASAQDAVVVALAAVEEEWSEDGTVVEVHRAAGHVAVDAASVVSAVLCLSAAQGERRVRSAVALAAGGAEGASSASGLGGLHVAMATGLLDAYRAGVLAEELESAPSPVAESVVSALEPFFGRDDATALRRRCRRVLARVSPDLLRQRAVRARAESRLERWVSEPGVDCWHGTFPSEEAARAWAAVDALAQRYVADGTCAEIGRARARALTDLVEGSATIETVLTLVVPHDGAGSGSDVTGSPVPGPSAPGPAAGAGTTDVVRGAVDALDGGVGPAGRGPARQSPVADGSGELPRGEVAPHSGEAASHSGGAGDLVEVAGVRAGEPLLVARRWLREAVASTALVGRHRAGRVRITVADPVTGALVDPDGTLTVPTYRPGRRLAALVRARDGRCRFPGCHVAARFCDLDHVRPWPAGATAAANLLCLCRRHHRVKQRPGWRVVLAADGSARWTGPTGSTRTTTPVDALHPLVLAATDREAGREASACPGGPAALVREAPQAVTRRDLPDGPHSVLEHRLEHHPTSCRQSCAHRVEAARDGGGHRRHQAVVHALARPWRGSRRRVPPPEDPPPF